MAKDLFSHHSASYARYRPTYPPELYQYIFSFLHKRERAWDCACGNGQAASFLAGYFAHVDATDISETQIAHAVQKQNIHYRVCPAEHTPFADNSFDLITVATAYHWLSWDAFQKEATRVGKQGAVVAIWAYYNLASNDDALNTMYTKFRSQIDPYWDPERRWLEEQYKTVPFDFELLPEATFESCLLWTREQFTGYLRTWSAVQNFRKRESDDPVDRIEAELKSNWKEDSKKYIRFPISLRLGRINK
jgi:SAM-dependent methyltransferase